MEQADDVLADEGWEPLLQAATLALAKPARGDGDPVALGTGFMVTPHLVATCAHVIAECPDELPVEVEGRSVVGGRTLTLRATQEHYYRNEAGLDLAFLQVVDSGDEGALPSVLLNQRLAVGDTLWAYGHPDGRYRAGESASFVCDGPARREPDNPLTLFRLRGTPVGGGWSGSAVVNRTTGAVCGVLCTSNLKGSAHILPIDELIQRCEPLHRQHNAPTRTHPDWLSRLSDDQLTAGGWLYPGRRLREYLKIAAGVAQHHPYPGVIPGNRPPPLSGVYVQPLARAGGGPSSSAQALPAEIIFLENRDIVLVGTAGGGKTSLFRMAMTALLKQWEQGIATMAPVRVAATDLVPARPLPEAIAASVDADLSALGLVRSWPAEFFGRPPAARAGWLVLVDGFDELMNLEHRRSVITQLAGAARAAPAGLYRFIVATRPLPNGEVLGGAHADPPWDPRPYELLPFTGKQFAHLAGLWFEQLNVPEDGQTAQVFMEQLRLAGLEELSRTPLMATILCQLFAANPEVALPHGRMRAYRAFVELLRERQFSDATSGIRQQIASSFAKYGRQAADASDQLLDLASDLVRQLAWRRQNGSAEPSVELLSGWTEPLRPACLSQVSWQTLLREILRRSGVLIERGGDFEFLHQTITEYLAAEYVVSDAERSDAEFKALFRPGAWSTSPSSIWRQSYARFLAAAWWDRPDLMPTLRRIAERGGLDGARFVGSLIPDGLELDTDVAERVLTRLSHHARKAAHTTADRRSAAELALRLDRPRGLSLLVSIAESESLELPYRRWAAEALNTAGDARAYDLITRLNEVAEYADSRPRNLRTWLTRLSGAVEPSPALQPLLSAVQTAHPKADLSMIETAYRTVERLLEGQTLKSGELSIRRPIAVATILAELGMTPSTLCAALLSGSGAHPDYSLEKLRQDFGEEIAYLVDGASDLDEATFGEHARAETIRKLVIAMARDIRVLVIKLADRLHTMRTLHNLDRAERERIVTETLYIYVPFARRLGMHALRCEMEDLTLATLHPKRYDEIVRLVAQRAPARDEYLRRVVDTVAHSLQASKVEAVVASRQEHYYSIYEKLNVRGWTPENVDNSIGIRILANSVHDCYASLGVVHGLWNPVSGQFKDYIAMPKFNVYQSLHSTVTGPEDRLIDVQIRTRDMDRRAMYGVAAGWRNEADVNDDTWSATNDMPWLRQLLDWQREVEDPDEFLESLRFEMSANLVYVFTPRGDVIDLPAGSTPVDFAYAVHADVGRRCVGARVNSRLVPLESRLGNGDVVEILTSKAENAGPSRDWLAFVQSPRAKTKIRQWFSKERRELAIEHGKDLLTRVVGKEGLPLQRVLSQDSITAVVADLNLPDVQALYAALGEGSLTVQSVLRRLVESPGPGAEAEDVEEVDGIDFVMLAQELKRRDLPRGTPGVEVKDAGDVWVKLGRCCTPVPGDPIVGFMTRGEGVSVHRRDCHNIGHLVEQPERIVEVDWSPTAQSLFLVQIQVEALSRADLLTDITRELSDQRVNILSALFESSRDRVTKCRFTFEIGNPKHLGHVLRAVRGVDGVFDVYRVTN